MQRPSKPEKTMSSRLLTMKFMQRAAHAAASNPSSTPQTPSSPRPTDRTLDSTPPSKRQRRSEQTASATDLEAISAAIRAEEEKRAAAIARQAAEAGETEWVLEFPGGPATGVKEQTHVVALESPDIYGAGRDDDLDGRQEYGGYKRKKRTAGDEEAGASINSRSRDDDNDESADDQPDGYRDERVRVRKRKHDQKNREVNLSKLTSISGAGGFGSGSPRQAKKDRKDKKDKRGRRSR